MGARTASGNHSSVASAHEVVTAIAQTSAPRPKKKTEKKKELTSSQFDAMMKAVRDGQGLLVKQRMESYSITESQRKVLETEINK